MRDDPVAPDHDELPVEGVPFDAIVGGDGLAGSKGCRGIGIEKRPLAFWIEMSEFAPATFPDSLGEVLVMIGEIQEGSAAALLFAHKDQRNLWGQQQQRDGDPDRGRIGQGQQAFAEESVADLVMVLQAVDEARGRQMCARSPARLAAEGRDLALEREALRQHAREMPGRFGGEAAVIGGGLTRQQDMDSVMEIVVPLRVETREQPGVVGVVLDHELDRTFRRDGAADLPFEIHEEIERGNGMDGVEPQPIEPVFVKPLDRAGNKISTDLRAIEVDRRTPWRMAAGAEELRRISMQIAAIRAEMIENNVEVDRKAEFMRLIDQSS